MTFPSTSLSRLAATAILALVALSVAGCGRRGDPETPTVTKPAAAADRPVGIPVGSTTKEAAPKRENKPFILDFLL